MQVVHDEYLADHCWIVMCDHHLDDRLSLYHVSKDCMLYKQYPLIRGHGRYCLKHM